MKECVSILCESHSHCKVKSTSCYLVRMQGGIECSGSPIGVIEIVRLRTNQWFGGRRLNCISWLEMGGGGGVKNSIKTELGTYNEALFHFHFVMAGKKNISINGLPLQSCRKLFDTVRNEDWFTCSLLFVSCVVSVCVFLSVWWSTDCGSKMHDWTRLIPDHFW